MDPQYTAYNAVEPNRKDGIHSPQLNDSKSSTTRHSLDFEKYCIGLGLSQREIAIAKRFRASSFGRGKILMDNFILVECGYRCSSYEENKLYAQQDLQRNHIPLMFFYDARYFNKQIILTYENFIRFTETSTISYRMTTIARQQITKYMKICLGFADLQYYNIVYNPLNVSEVFFMRHQHLLSSVLLLPTLKVVSRDGAASVSGRPPTTAANTNHNKDDVKNGDGAPKLHIPIHRSELTFLAGSVSGSISGSGSGSISGSGSGSISSSISTSGSGSVLLGSVSGSVSGSISSSSSQLSLSSIMQSQQSTLPVIQPLMRSSTQPSIKPLNSQPAIINSLCRLFNPIKKSNKSYSRHLVSMFTSIRAS